MSYGKRWFALLAVAVSVGCGNSEDSNSKNQSVHEGGAPPNLDFSAYDAAVSQFLTDHNLEGAGSVIVHDEWGIVHNMGYGNFSTDRIYLIASSSKVLSVGIIMRLADQGLIDIDAPVGNYVSAWGAGKPELTIAQMVSNSSGLVGLVDNPLYGPYLCQYLQAGTLTDCGKTIYTADDAADRIPPDTEFHYGGGQWQLAGAIAEFVSGKPWADLVRETYVQPCNTTLGYANQFQQAFAAGGDGGSVGAALSYPSFFLGDPNNLAPTQNPSIEGGAYGTAEDYAKILLMHLRGGVCDDNRVLSEDAVARMRVDRILSYGGTTSLAGMSAGDFAGYGLGWWVDRVNTGVFADPGAYGAMPWLDLPRHYAAIIMLEADTGLGTQLYSVVKPLVDAAFDAAK